ARNTQVVFVKWRTVVVKFTIPVRARAPDKITRTGNPQFRQRRVFLALFQVVDHILHVWSIGACIATVCLILYNSGLQRSSDYLRYTGRRADTEVVGIPHLGLTLFPAFCRHQYHSKSSTRSVNRG